MNSYHGRKPVFNGNEEKMSLRPRNNNNTIDTFDTLTKDISTKLNSKKEEILYDENIVLSIPELSKNIKPRKASIRNNFKVNIPIPHFEVHDFTTILNEAEDKNEDISDLAYNNRHRKYELAEKRVKNRENEILQYHLYKMQELEKKKHHMEINNLIPYQNEIINNTSDSCSSTSSMNSNNIKSEDTENIKITKDIPKKNKRQIKNEKTKNHLKKNSKERTFGQLKSIIPKEISKKEKNKEKLQNTKNKKGNEIKKEMEINKEIEITTIETENKNETEEKKEEKINDNENNGENDYENLLKNKQRMASAIEKLLSCRINPYPDENRKVRRCSRKLKAFGVPLPLSLNKPIVFDNIIVKQNYLNLNHSKHRMSKRFRTTCQQLERKNIIDNLNA
ncbi:hypothetical protein BCR36DRAFT_351352 [Piromyces finnis]|uniref:Something about silencing protein 4 domain-containing protein n=1 Tax=Piromyces finnis TaxID=1754191 RepID=A0A1Y1VB65_9FUNG|nr:hypothetical protein BCR36DRAFT_351352 [Piromyces finnis]|eukprot:ORX51497.1 hypothetical protein BCR36DRAFT_351352 [Piromyces finnis]